MEFGEDLGIIRLGNPLSGYRTAFYEGGRLNKQLTIYFPKSLLIDRRREYFNSFETSGADAER